MLREALFQNIPDPVWWTLGGIFALLILASVLVRVLRLIKPDKTYAELGTRIRTWWIIVGIFASVIVLSKTAALWFLGFVSFLALKEYLSMIPTRRADRRVLFWAYLAIPVQYYLVGLAWYDLFIIFIPVYIFLLLPMRMVMIGRTEGFLRAAGTVHWGVMTTVFCISHAGYLLMLKLPSDPDRVIGPGLLLMLVLLTQFNDVAQYCWGKTIGGKKIVPAVSPGKTWAGFIGGFVTTLLVSGLLGPWLTPMNWQHSVLAGALIAVAGFVGDIVISAIKRDLGIKDASSFLPGHGGVLDRIDSLTFTAPLFFHFVVYLYCPTSLT